MTGLVTLAYVDERVGSTPSSSAAVASDSALVMNAMNAVAAAAFSAGMPDQMT